jgi:hypothetical protein
LQVVEDFGLLRFMPLHVEDKHSMAALLRSVDKANGYAFSGRPDAQAMQSYSAVATGMSLTWPLAVACCFVRFLCASDVLSIITVKCHHRALLSEQWPTGCWCSCRLWGCRLSSRFRGALPSCSRC